MHNKAQSWWIPSVQARFEVVNPILCLKDTSYSTEVILNLKITFTLFFSLCLPSSSLWFANLLLSIRHQVDCARSGNWTALLLWVLYLYYFTKMSCPSKEQHWTTVLHARDDLSTNICTGPSHPYCFQGTPWFIFTVMRIINCPQLLFAAKIWD